MGDLVKLSGGDDEALRDLCIAELEAAIRMVKSQRRPVAMGIVLMTREDGLTYCHTVHCGSEYFALMGGLQTLQMRLDEKMPVLAEYPPESEE